MEAANAIEHEVNQIRLAIYEKTKDMTPTQLTEYYKKNTEATIKKYGFTIVENAKDARNRTAENPTSTHNNCR